MNGTVDNNNSETNRPIVGRRPKSKDSNGHAMTVSTKKGKEVIGLKRICANPLDRLCEILLDWDFGNSITRAANSSKEGFIGWTHPDFIKLPLTFSSFQEYITAWEPLMIEELRENVISNYKTKNRNEIKKGYIQFKSTDRLPQVTHTIDAVAVSTTDNSNDPENLPNVMDLILISPQLIGNAYRLNEPVPAGPVVIGMVISSSIVNGVKSLQIRVRSKFWTKFSSYGKLADGKGGIAASTTQREYLFRMHYSVVENIRSNWREYQAIHELGVNVPLLPEILGSHRAALLDGTDYNDNSNVEQIMEEEKKALLESNQEQVLQNEDTLIRQENIPKDFIQYLKSKFNSSQYYSIQLAATKDGFTLIQGPPGSGKTSTIIGVLNTVHLREFNRYYEDLIEVFTNQQKLLQHQKQMSFIHGTNLTKEDFVLNVLQSHSKSKPRILIVAPSNIAVDNIITRIMKDGFLDGYKSVYRPEMVRVGGGRTHSVESVSLEYLIDQECHNDRTFTEKQELLEDYSKRISVLIQEIIQLQSILMTLVQSFSDCKPLPEGWELRVSVEHLHPYWVDHKNKSTSNEPPLALVREIFATPQSPSAASVPKPKIGYGRVEELPEYMIASHRFIQLLSSLEQLSLKRNRLGSVINIQTLRGKETIPMSVKETLETSIIEGAQLLFTTLNSCGHPSMEAAEFCVTVMDEAAQSTEPSTLIALRKGCRKCIMVGDQRQLPATIFSETVMKYNYNRSLFERLIESGHSYVMLDQQYRMTPEISEFPSKFFYYSKLLNGENVKELNYLPLFIRPNRLFVHNTTNHENRGWFDSVGNPPQSSSSTTGSLEMVPVLRENDYSLFYPLMFFNLKSSKDVTTSSSKINLEEIQLCIQLIKILYMEVERVFQILRADVYSQMMAVITSTTALHSERKQQERLLQEKIAEMVGPIGIITPYSEQLNELEKEFSKQGLIRRRPGGDILTGKKDQRKNNFSKYQRLNIELNTVDGFQGKEKDIIILSTVRANEERKIGFLSDVRRLNVAITRARYSLFIVGNADTLYTNRYWKYLLNHVQTQNAMVKVPNCGVSLKRLLVQHQQKYSNYPKNPPVTDEETVAVTINGNANGTGYVDGGNSGKESPPPPPPPASPRPYETYDDYPSDPSIAVSNSSIVQRVYHQEKQMLEADQVYYQFEFQDEPHKGTVTLEGSSYPSVYQDSAQYQILPTRSHLPPLTAVEEPQFHVYHSSANYSVPNQPLQNYMQGDDFKYSHKRRAEDVYPDYHNGNGWNGANNYRSDSATSNSATFSNHSHMNYPDGGNFPNELYAQNRKHPRREATCNASNRHHFHGNNTSFPPNIPNPRKPLVSKLDMEDGEVFEV